MAKKKTTATKQDKKITAPEPEVVEEVKVEAPEEAVVQPNRTLGVICILIGIFFLLPFVIRGGGCALNWTLGYYKSILLPKPIQVIDNAIQKRKERRKKGFSWRIRTGVPAWIESNLPAVPPEEAEAVADVYYNVADEIDSGAITSSAVAVAQVKRGLLEATGNSAEWDTFLSDLSDEIGEREITSLDEVADTFAEIAEGIENAAKPRATAPESVEIPEVIEPLVEIVEPVPDPEPTPDPVPEEVKPVVEEPKPDPVHEVKEEKPKQPQRQTNYRYYYNGYGLGGLW